MILMAATTQRLCGRKDWTEAGCRRILQEGTLAPEEINYCSENGEEDWICRILAIIQYLISDPLDEGEEGRVRFQDDFHRGFRGWC